MAAPVHTVVTRMRGSLFLIPMLCVLGGVLLAQGMLLLDGWALDLDSRLGATVDSARTVLTTVAGATLTFAGIAFSVSLLLISMASNQFSPRVVHGMFRDPFNKRVMGLVVGTFTYCLVVLRAVRESVDDAGDPVVPSISILLALVLGITSVLAIIAFINHSAHSMDVSRILNRVTREALTQIRATWPDDEPSTRDPQPAAERTGEPVLRARFDEDGWVQDIDHEQVLTALPAGSSAVLRTSPGRYAVAGTVICDVWSRDGDAEAVERTVRAAVSLGSTRTVDMDVSYGLRQLVDVALKALSPGVNDPTTAHDALRHVGTVLAELLRRVPPVRVMREDDRTLELGAALTQEDMVGIAFDEVRLAAAELPTVLVHLLDMAHQVVEALEGRNRPEAVAALRRQAALLAEVGERAEVPEPDRRRVREAHQERFGART